MMATTTTTATATAAGPTTPPAPPPTALDRLIQDLQRIFADDHVNTEHVRKALEAYKSDPKDWRRFAHFDPHKYTRNLVDVGNGKYNLMILCWGPGMGSSIHDHTDSHCFVKVLQGELVETRFAWPQPLPSAVELAPDGGALEPQDAPLAETGREQYTLNGVTYINDQIGLHRMENPSHSSPAVTLHLYIPPYSSCFCFDQRTGRKQKAVVTFYTKYGQLVDYSEGCKEGRLVPLPAATVAAPVVGGGVMVMGATAAL